jgi:hypothetical protein
MKPSVTRVQIRDRLISLYDLGSPLNDHFIRIYENQSAINLDSFRKDVADWLNSHYDDYEHIDCFFNNFVDLWEKPVETKHFKLAEHLWKKLLAIVGEWETTNDKKIQRNTLLLLRRNMPVEHQPTILLRWIHLKCANTSDQSCQGYLTLLMEL